MAVRPESPLEVGEAFHRLGWTSFGGPTAHFGFFRDAFVQRRRWLNDVAFAELLALVQLLPGPSSTQLAVIIGIGRAGLTGGLMAWLAFTLPSAVLMVAFGFAAGRYGEVTIGPVLHGLEIAVVGVVAQAVLAMGRRLCPDATRRLTALLAAAVALLISGPIGQLLAIGLGAAIGRLRLSGRDQHQPDSPAFARLGPRIGAASLALFVLLLVGLPLLRTLTDDPLIALIDAFYRPGALVFGGGHVILPLLQAELVPPGWISPELFLAGYGAAQAVPGPLFTFAAYLGTVIESPLPPLLSAVVCLVALSLPSGLLILGVLPFWARWREVQGMADGLAGVGAAVVGLLIAALIDPILPSAIETPIDLLLAAGVFGLLLWGRLPPWLIVLGCAALAAPWAG